MKSEEKLLLAIGEIDESIIAEASADYKRKFVFNKKALAVAASVAVVAVTISMLPGLLLGRLDKDAAGGDAAPEMNGGMLESGKDVRVESYGSLTYNGKKSDDKFSFTLIIVTDATSPIDIYLYDNDPDVSIVYTTANNMPSDMEVRRPTITVNGEAASALPTTAGEYEITINFDGLEETVKWNNLFKVGDFGDFHRKDFTTED